jgi:drug/metabolite transporter (DMT)-like permease
MKSFMPKLLLLGLLWGSSFIFIELALEGFGPLTIVFIRVVMASLTLMAIVILQKHALPRKLSLWGKYALLGLVSNVLPFSLITWGQQHITAGMASVLNAAVPLFAVLLAHRFSKDETITLRKLLGVMLGLCGVIILMLPQLDGGLSAQNFGQLAVLLGAFCYGIAVVFGKNFSGTPAVVNAACMLACSSIMLLPAVLILEWPATRDPDLSSWLAVIGLAELSGALAYLLYFKILAENGAVSISLVTFLIPIVATLLGSVLLGERFKLVEGIGVLVIFSAIAVINQNIGGKLFSRFKKTT